jgi:enamine deaminase RidA (YjgF/YER057c/UK114 family)
MRVTVVPRFGTEVLALSAEARPDLDPAAALRDLAQRFDGELRRWDLSLDNTVRSRLWARDREARDVASKERVAVLSGKARSSSSSFIAPAHFDSDASVALDLWALRASGDKFVQEYAPPIAPIRYLTWGSAVYLSGVTWEHEALPEQLDNILPRIGQSLTDAGTSWRKAVRMSCFLHRSQAVADLRRLLAAKLGEDLPREIEIGLVDGYSALGKLIEIEVTAAK